MLKTREQMWAFMSQLPKDIPNWLNARVSALPFPGGNAGTETDTVSVSGTHRAAGASETAPDTRSQPKAEIATPTGVISAADTSESTVQDTPAEGRAKHLEDKLLIPICTDCPDVARRQSLQDQGQFLARQERWEELSALIRTADRNQTCTPGGLAEADLLAFGARADVVNAVEHALEDASVKGAPANDNRALIAGIMALEALRGEHRLNSYLTALVALAHVDIAWIWRRSATDETNAKTAQRRAAAHFDRAAALMAPLKDDCEESAFLSSAQCALYAGKTEDTLRVADAYAALIDRDAGNPRHMRGLGMQMLPRANGSYAALELEARRTAARTQELWGAGGYTWVYFDAMALDGQACARVDPKFFMDGLQDILCANPSQEMINLLTAYCGVTLRHDSGRNDQAEATRRQICEASRWLVRSHLRELHPLVWAHATRGFDNSARVTSVRRFAARGQAEALECIARVFHEEIDSGHRISFTPEGFDLLQG